MNSFVGSHLCVLRTGMQICMLVVLSAAAPTSAFSANNPMDICDQAALHAAKTRGVPVDVLRAITRTETGRKRGLKFGPWPWTVNMEGKGVWFDSDDAARAYVYKHFKRGARSFDVGCFQINYRWHHQEFTSLEEMFEPFAGADYAARFLKDLYAELGSWEEAAGAYHSRTLRHANRYKAAYRKHLAKVKSSPLHARATPSRKERPNRFPLLTARNGPGAAGSTVPLAGTGLSQGIFTAIAARSFLE